MMRCKCGSFAINIEGNCGENAVCDVCHWKHKFDSLRKENARYREALKKIAAGGGIYTRESSRDWHIAKTALSEGEKK